MDKYMLNETVRGILRELVETEAAAMRDAQIAKERTRVGIEMAAAGAGAPSGSTLRPDLSGFDGPEDGE